MNLPSFPISPDQYDRGHFDRVLQVLVQYLAATQIYQVPILQSNPPLQTGAVYFNSTDNTLRFGTPTQWETITPSAYVADLNGKENVGVAQLLLNAHVAATNPHPQYASSTDIAALAAAINGKENIGVAATLDNAHIAAANPHTQYALNTDLASKTHNSLVGIQGGATADYQHLTSAQVVGLAGGVETALHLHKWPTVSDTISSTEVVTIPQARQLIIAGKLTNSGKLINNGRMVTI